MNLLFNEIIRILIFVFENVRHIWPLLLITIPLAVILKGLNISSKINELFNKNIWLSIFIATVIGAFSPFCSCSVILVISSMLIAGVPLGPMMAFWLASPSMDPEIFFLSVSSLGWKLAVSRMIATFLMSFTGGVITYLLLRKMDPTKYLKLKMNENKNKKKAFLNSKDNKRKGSSDFNLKVIEEDSGCPEGHRTDKIKSLMINILESTWFVLKFLLIAYVLEALIVFYVPSELIIKAFGPGPFKSVMTASFIGLPLYTTNISALGLMGGLIDKGLTPGAGLAFLVAGATTTIPAMTAIYKLVHRKIFLIYILVTLSFAILSGLSYNLLFL